MSVHQRASRLVGIDALAAHPDRLDVRSPSEFAEDHLPGAINTPHGTRLLTGRLNNK